MFKLQNTVVHSVCHIPPYTALLKPKSTSPRHNFCSCIIRTLMLLWVRHAPGFPPESTHGVGQPFAAETAQDPSLKTQRDSRLVDTSVGHTWTIRIALAKASRNRVLESKSLQCLPKKKSERDSSVKIITLTPPEVLDLWRLIKCLGVKLQISMTRRRLPQHLANGLWSESATIEARPFQLQSPHRPLSNWSLFVGCENSTKTENHFGQINHISAPSIFGIVVSLNPTSRCMTTCHVAPSSWGIVTTEAVVQTLRDISNSASNILAFVFKGGKVCATNCPDSCDSIGEWNGWKILTVEILRRPTQRASCSKYSLEPQLARFNAILCEPLAHWKMMAHGCTDVELLCISPTFCMLPSKKLTDLSSKQLYFLQTFWQSKFIHSFEISHVFHRFLPVQSCNQKWKWKHSSQLLTPIELCQMPPQPVPGRGVYWSTDTSTHVRTYSQQWGFARFEG